MGTYFKSTQTKWQIQLVRVEIIKKALKIRLTQLFVGMNVQINRMHSERQKQLQ